MRINALFALALTAAGANAAVVPFTETFESGANNWLQGSFTAPTYNTTGALDGSAFISSTIDLNTAGPFGITVFRGHDEFDASGDAFVGDYLAGGINTVSFDFRHNAGQDLDIALRVATPANFPSLVVELPEGVASGEWVTLSFELDFFNPLLTIGGAPTPDTFNSIMQNIGNVQISSGRPDGLDTPFLVDFDIDNIAITPAPGSLALLGLGGLAATRRRR